MDKEQQKQFRAQLISEAENQYNDRPLSAKNDLPSWMICDGPSTVIAARALIEFGYMEIDVKTLNETLDVIYEKYQGDEYNNIINNAFTGVEPSIGV